MTVLGFRENLETTLEAAYCKTSDLQELAEKEGRTEDAVRFHGEMIGIEKALTIARNLPMNDF